MYKGSDIMCNNMMPMMPNMMLPNMMMPNMMIPFSNNTSNYTTNNDINTKIDIIERQIKRLDERVSRLEATINNNINTKFEENNSMYMM